jgi:hypothetical protein
MNMTMTNTLAYYIMARVTAVKSFTVLPQDSRIPRQGDQIGQNFAIWAIFYGIGQIFI